jgi:hypothetical protein
MLKNCLFALLLAGTIYSAAPMAIAQDSPNDQQAPPAAGPQHGGGHFDPETRAQMLGKHLNLTADQQAKVLDILKSAQSQMENLRSDSSASPADRRSKMMEIHRSSDDQIRAVLDSNQQKRFDEIRSRPQQRQGRGQNGQQQGPPPDSSEPK